MATMAQAIKEAFEEGDGILSREAIRQFIESRYPGKWQPTTFNAHLYARAINNARAPKPFAASWSHRIFLMECSMQPGPFRAWRFGAIAFSSASKTEACSG